MIVEEWPVQGRSGRAPGLIPPGAYSEGAFASCMQTASCSWMNAHSSHSGLEEFKILIQQVSLTRLKAALPAVILIFTSVTLRFKLIQIKLIVTNKKSHNRPKP